MTKNLKKKTMKALTNMFVIIYQLSSNSNEKIFCPSNKKLKKRIKKYLGKLLTGSIVDNEKIEIP